ncbi:MAG: radical SAM protein [Candidatus Sumerlaeota bacterium]|nr:radical SAM protein [Candidatus Sumerlaeota bacterium]
MSHTQDYAYSGQKIFWHGEKLRALAEGRVSAPIYVRVKPTNRCNHRCYYCSYQEDKRLVTAQQMNPKDEIPFEKMCEILEDFRDIGVKAVTYSGGGEPLIYPRIEEILRRTLDCKIDLSVITNGSRLDGAISDALAHAHWVRVSLDSVDAANYAKIRQVSEKELPKILGNLRRFAAMKRPECELGVNFVIGESNAHEVYEACRVIRDTGANHIKLTARNTPDFHKDHEPFKARVLEQIARAKAELPTPEFRIHSVYEEDFIFAGVYERRYCNCAIMEIVPVIGADQKVYFCHDKTYTKKGEIGDIATQSFKQLWFSERTRDCFKTFDARVECRHHCTYDARNMAINEFLKSWSEHINFI